MKRILMNIMIVLGLALVPVVATSSPAYAGTSTCGDGTSSKGQVLQSIGQTGNDCNDNGVLNAIGVVVEILSIIAGAVAIIMILISGFKYMTSSGDSGKISNAKTTLIYALVGLAIAVLAQLLVRVVITQSEKAVTATPPSQSQRRP